MPVRPMAGEGPGAPMQESLAAAVKAKAMRLSDLTQAVVDTTVQVTHRARERLFRLARRHRVRLRQSYARPGKFNPIKHQRYAHAKQFKRASKCLRRLKT